MTIHIGCLDIHKVLNQYLISLSRFQKLQKLFHPCGRVLTTTHIHRDVFIISSSCFLPYLNSNLRIKFKKHTKGSIKPYHKGSEFSYKAQDSDWYIGKNSSLLAKTGQYMQWLCVIVGMSTVCHS